MRWLPQSVGGRGVGTVLAQARTALPPPAGPWSVQIGHGAHLARPVQDHPHKTGSCRPPHKPKSGHGPEQTPPPGEEDRAVGRLESARWHSAGQPRRLLGWSRYGRRPLVSSSKLRPPARHLAALDPLQVFAGCRRLWRLSSRHGGRSRRKNLGPWTRKE